MFKGHITGQLYETAEAMKAGEKEYIQRQEAQSTPDYFDDPNAPTAEQILNAARFVEQANTDHAREANDERAAEVFCQLHPEFVQNPRNAATIEMLLRERGVVDDRFVT